MKKLLTVVLAVAVMLSAAACGTYEWALPHLSYGVSGEYNTELFYRNDMVDGPDPGVMLCTDEADTENYGWFFAYPTADSTFGTNGFMAYRSKDLHSWESVGVVYEPTADSYGQSSHWAPECVYDKDTDLYYLFYSSNDKYNPDDKVFDSVAEREEYRSIEAEVSALTGADYEAVISPYIEANREAFTDADLTKPESVSKKTANGVKLEYSYYDNFVNQAAAARAELDALNAEKSGIEGDGTLQNEEKERLLAEIAVKIAAAEQEHSEREAAMHLDATDLYLLVRTAHINHNTPNNDYALGVAVSSSPTGPFVQYTNEAGKDGYDESQREIDITTPWLSHEDLYTYAYEYLKEQCPVDTTFTGIDPTPFVDPVSGKKYLYWARRTGTANDDGHYVLGVEMGEKWTDDPKWETITRLTRRGYKTVDGDEKADAENVGWLTGVNEGPFMYYNKDNGKYYLTWSNYGYDSKKYCVTQAIGDSPLGKFTKLSVDEGAYVVKVDEGWTHASGTGHHCFVEYGEELYIIYHGHYNKEDGVGQRGMNVDRVVFVDNGKGQTVMQTNGPTYSLQPKIGSEAKYENIASKATVSVKNGAEGASAAALTDGAITSHDYYEFVPEFSTHERKKTTVAFSFDTAVTVRALMVYNSIFYDRAFDKITRIELDFVKTVDGKTHEGVAYIDGLAFSDEHINYVDEESVYMLPGGSAIAEFEELSVTEIRFIFDEEKSVSVSEIVILGRM